jgi:homogentisate 1,2-dioxygenase
MFLVVFIGKSDRFADLPFSAVTKMASVREAFRPDQSTISTKIMAKHSQTMKICSLGYQGIDVIAWIGLVKN